LQQAVSAHPGRSRDDGIAVAEALRDQHHRVRTGRLADRDVHARSHRDVEDAPRPAEPRVGPATVVADPHRSGRLDHLPAPPGRFEANTVTNVTVISAESSRVHPWRSKLATRDVSRAVPGRTTRRSSVVTFVRPVVCLETGARAPKPPLCRCSLVDDRDLLAEETIDREKFVVARGDPGDLVDVV